MSPPRYYPGGQWSLPASPELFRSWGSGYTVPDSYPVDGRGVTYYWGFSSVRRVGQGMHQTCLFATRDRDGQALDGSRSYRPTVPPDVPASQYGVQKPLLDKTWKLSDIEPVS
jgi:hypothetical protein